MSHLIATSGDKVGIMSEEFQHHQFSNDQHNPTPQSILPKNFSNLINAQNKQAKMGILEQK